MGGVEFRAPWVGRVYDWVGYFVSGEVFAAEIYGEVAKFAGDLGLKLEERRIGGVVVEVAGAVEVAGNVEVPKFQRGFV